MAAAQVDNFKTEAHRIPSSPGFDDDDNNSNSSSNSSSDTSLHGGSGSEDDSFLAPSSPAMKRKKKTPARDRSVGQKKKIDEEWKDVAGFIIRTFKEGKEAPTYQSIFEYSKDHHYSLTIPQLRARINTHFLSLARTSSQPFTAKYTR